MQGIFDGFCRNCFERVGIVGEEGKGNLSWFVKYNLGRKMIVVLNSSYVIKRFFNVCKASWFLIVKWFALALWSTPGEGCEAFQTGVSVAHVFTFTPIWKDDPDWLICFIMFYVLFTNKHGWKFLIVFFFNSWRLVQVSVFLRLLHSDTGHYSVWNEQSWFPGSHDPRML